MGEIVKSEYTSRNISPKNAVEDDQGYAKDQSQTTSACCEPVVQETCCEPSDKASCCGTSEKETVESQACGCQ